MNKEKIMIFLEFVEIRTKLASVMPMLIGFLWTSYHYQQFNWLNSIIFACAVLAFDMCTTAINNTVDYHKALNLEYKEQENVIGKYNLQFKKMVKIILILLGIAIFFSLVLVFLTDVLLLVLGVICFVIGITYTFGPLPLSRSPFGEIFSGFTMGFGIFFLAIYMTMFSEILTSSYEVGRVLVSFNWHETLLVFLMSIPLVCFIANIMLANNTCDLETDITNQRFTLVYYIGRRNAVLLYQLLSLIPWISWLLYIVTGLLPLWALLTVPLIYVHYQSVQRFVAKQVKNETFVEALKSFVLFSGMYLLVLMIELLIGLF